MSARQRVGSAPYEDFTLGVQGWSALTVFAVVMVLNSLIMTLRPPGWRSMAWATGVAARWYINEKVRRAERWRLFQVGWRRRLEVPDPAGR
jgi:hypothetical protein